MKLAIYLLSFFGIASTVTAGDWNLAKDKNGIMVYTRESVGSPIKEFKAVTTLDATVAEVLATIKDYENYHVWYDHCKSGYLINEKLDGSRIYYIEMAMPFPFSNRDMVGQMVITKNGDWVEVNITGQKDVLDEIDGIVRMPVTDGSWRLKQVAPGKVEVHHQFKGDPAGNIPTGIVNLFLVAGPINTMTQLQAYLSKK